MVAEFSGRSTELIKALGSLPQIWQLTPVNGNKRPYQGDWQKKGIDRKALEKELKSGKAKGYGLLTGEKSGGILAIDADGPAAQELLAKHGELPATVAFTSGKLGRCQYLLQIDESYWGVVKTIKLNTGVKGENGKDQLLEFRWDGCQSVLPPSAHPETERYQWVNSPDSVEIAECPNWVIELIRNAEDAAKPESALPLSYAVQSHSAVSRPENIPLPVPETIPLEVCLAKSSRDLLNGVSEGGRNDAGTALARDLIGTANYLNSIGQRFDDDPEMMLNDFAARCSPPLPAREVEAIWKSASKGNPSPACKSEGVDNCIRGWYWNNYAKKTSGQAISRSSNVITHPRFTPPDPAELREQITALINAGINGSKLTSEIISLAKGANPQGIWRIYQEILEEIERADDRLDRKRDIENLIKISNRRLTLENYLHPSLAEPIKKVTKWMGVDPEAVLTHLLPIVAGLINPNSRIVAKECINFAEPFLLYTGVVSKTGSRKSPTLDVAKHPLSRLQSIEDARHQQALQLYEAELQTSTESKKKSNDELPQKPKPPREFYLDNATVESVDKVKGQQPDHGCTLIKDELSGLFASHGAYKGGKGSDKESYLSGWNGGGVKKNRSGDGSRVSLARDSLSITGGIQPDKLRVLLGDFNDSQGEWARFLWYHMPMRPYKIPRDDTRYDLGDLLEAIYKKIDALPVLKLHFDKQGQTYWDDWHDEKDEQKRAETRPGLQAAIAKMPGQSVRLIGLLHVLSEVASGAVDVREEIPLTIVKSGCQLAEFYLGQVTLLQSEGGADTGELSPIFKKLLEKVAELKNLTARQAIQTIRDLKQIKAPKVRELFTELKAMGLADTQGTGTRMILVQKVLADSKDCQKDQVSCPVDISGNNTLEVLASVDKVLTSNLQPQLYTEAVFQDAKQKNVGTVDTIKTFESSPQSPRGFEVTGSGEDKQVGEIFNEGANTPTLSTQNYIEQAIEGVGEKSTVDVNTSENANTSLIAPLELETAPKSNAEWVLHMAAKVRKAIAENDAGAIKKEIAKMMEMDSTGRLHLAVKAYLEPNEKEAYRILLANSKQPQPPTVAAPEPIALTDKSPEQESAETLPEVEPATEPEPTPENAPETAPTPETTPVPEPASETVPETAPETTPEPEPTGTPIENLNLSCRAYNALQRAKINTIERLLTYTPQSLLEIKNAGQRTVDEVVEGLQKLGFSLASEPIAPPDKSPAPESAEVLPEVEPESTPESTPEPATEPVLESATAPEPVPTPEPARDPEPALEPAAEVAPVTEPATVPEVTPALEATPEPAAETTPEPEPTPEPASETATEPEPIPEAATVPEAATEPATVPEPVLVPEPEVTPAPEITSETVPATEPATEPATVPEPAPTPQFKIGDRIRVISAKSDFHGKYGKIHQISSREIERNLIILFDKDKRRKKDLAGFVSASEIELVVGPEVVEDAK